MKIFMGLLVTSRGCCKGVIVQRIMTPKGFLTNGQSLLRIKWDVTGASFHAPRQSNRMYVQTVRQSIYETRQPDDQNTLTRLSIDMKDAPRYPFRGPVTTFSIIKCWVGASNRTHMDCKGHSDAMMSLGKGDVYSYSRNKKLNTKSSTES